MQTAIQEFMKKIEPRNGHETKFLQAVYEVAESIVPFAEQNPKYKSIKYWKE